MNRTSILPYVGFGFVLLIIISYALFRFFPLLVGPEIRLISPSSYLVTEQESIMLEIETKRVVKLEIQGLSVDIQKDGVTEYPYFLSDGVNRISVYAEDGYGSSESSSLLVIKKSGKLAQ